MRVCIFCDRYIFVQWMIKERKDNGFIYLREQAEHRNEDCYGERC